MLGCGAERQRLGTCHLAGAYDQKKSVTSHTVRPVAPLISQSYHLGSPLMGGSSEEVLRSCDVQESPKQGIDSLVSILYPSFSSLAIHLVTNMDIYLDRESVS